MNNKHVKGMSRRRWLCLSAVAGVSAGSLGCMFSSDPGSSKAPEPEKQSYEVLSRHPHSLSAYTQGLIYHQGYLYESTGLTGKSTLRKVDVPTGKVLKKIALPANDFGEGLTLWKDQLIQLTWKSRKAYVYRETNNSFEKVAEHWYPREAHEGWGLTHDGQNLIMSDKTNRLLFLDPESFQVQRHLDVRDELGPLDAINEMEIVNGKIYANVFGEDWIAEISPNTGNVTSKIDASGLLPWENRRALADHEVLNGIAYDAEKDRWFITGKHWPFLFEIRLKA